MGDMTRLEMQTEVLARINRSSSDMGSLVNAWLYRGLLDLCTYRKFFENEKTDTMTQSSAANTATWPTDLYWPMRLEYSDGNSLHICTVKDLIYVRELYSVNSTGRPDYVARFGASAYFDRTADQDYAWTVYYKFRPADFSGDSSTTDLGSEWDEALILWAVSAGFSRLRQFDVAQAVKNNYYSYVRGRLGSVEQIEEAWNESFAGDVDDDPFSF